MHKWLCRALLSDALARTGIKFPSNGIMLDLSVIGQVCSLGEMLSEHAVFVFVDATLTGTVRLREVYLDAGYLGEPSG